LPLSGRQKAAWLGDRIRAGVLTRHDVAHALAIARADVLALLAGRTTPRMHLTDDVFTAPRYDLAPEGNNAELRRALVDAASVLARSTLARMPSNGRIAMRLLLAARIPPALLVVVNGFLVLVALSVLVSIWFGRTVGD
jgi:hypothetical protein